nr:RICIN domain-containing protein [Streptomyces sp. CB00455]
MAAPLQPAQAANATAIQNLKTGRCLDSNAAGEVYTLPCQGGNNYQHWDTYQDGSGWWKLRNTATGRCLDANGRGQVYTLPCQSGNDYQLWEWDGPDGSGASMHLLHVQDVRSLDGNAQGGVYTLPTQWDNGYQIWNPR